MILLGVASEAQEMVFIHLTVNGKYIVDHYEDGKRIHRTLPMERERLIKKYADWFDLSGICLDVAPN